MTIEKKQVFKENLRKVGKAVWSVLPDILFYISIICWSSLLVMGISESAKEEARTEMLTAENCYLKEEIEWYKTLLADENGVEIPALPASAEDDLHE